MIALCAILAVSGLEADWLHPETLRQCANVLPHAVTRESDAAGGCDGVKTGKWGFHTENEDKPWWQVDLGQSLALDRMVLFNRCDIAARNARIIVSFSEDGNNFQQAYQHDGTVFYGFTDSKPLTIPLKGAKARYVRLQLPGKSYFHLDEVEIYDGERNVALGKSATQSSVSQWSVAHGGAPKELPTVTVVERGLKLAEELRGMGVAVDEDARQLKAEKDYLNAQRAVRRLALKNPLLDFDAILFAKSAPTFFPHMSDQFYGWWSRPGGGIFILENFKGDNSRVRCLTADMAAGSFIRPELSYDGKKVLFAYARHYPEVEKLNDKRTKANVPEDAFYHVFEMNIDGTGRRQLTRGRYDDFDARYLPNGDILFLSTRKGIFPQVSCANTRKTLDADLPDSYVRCGGDTRRPVPVFTLHAMDRDGGNMSPLSAFENFEYTPSVASDGRILYTRWDYIDRFNGPFFSLWSANTDGTNPQLVYGNYTTRPQVKCEPRSVPNSSKIVFTASAHHSIIGGSLVLLDRSRGTEGDAPITRLTPDVPFPETEKNVDSYYANPWPLSENLFLVAWSNRKLPPHCRADDARNPVNATGLYLLDASGNRTELYRDPEMSSGCPIPVKPRPLPSVSSRQFAWDGKSAGFFVQDVYVGLDKVPRGTVKRLRVVAVPPKVQPHMNNPVIGVSKEDPGKYVLGTAPVNEDGSVFFRVPSGVSVFFQALDKDGVAVQTMRSLTYVAGGQTLSCVGCHESRDSAPPVLSAKPRGEPSALTSDAAGTWPFRYDVLVQPVLDKHCVGCHRPDSDKPEAAKLNLTAASSYQSLLCFAGKDLQKLAFERNRSVPGECVAQKSKLLARLRTGHGKLPAEELYRLVVWMDLYATRVGSFSPEQEKELEQIRVEWTKQ